MRVVITLLLTLLLIPNIALCCDREIDFNFSKNAPPNKICIFHGDKNRETREICTSEDSKMAWGNEGPGDLIVEAVSVKSGKSKVLIMATEPTDDREALLTAGCHRLKIRATSAYHLRIYGVTN